MGACPAGQCLVQPGAVGQIDVEPSVIVVIEEGDAAALGLDDVALVIEAAPDVGDGESGLRVLHR